jgi:PhoPQ-activated pathogenicity-related protein/PKD repeat protein
MSMSNSRFSARRAARQPRSILNPLLRLAWVVSGVAILLLLARTAGAVDLQASHSPSNGVVEVTLTGGTGQWHRIEASTNLLDWRALTNLCQTNATSAWLDTGATNFPSRFYRSLQLTPLDVYVATPDTNYSYTLLSTIPGTGQTTFVLELQSQVWLTTNEVDRTLWKHWLIIVEPTGVTNAQSFLFIDGGDNPGTVPTSGDPNLTRLALDTQTIVTQLRMVPNQPLTFAGETSGRREDAIIAYSWDKYLRTGDARRPARLPMTKAAVRAMDTVTEFCGSAPGGGVKVSSFVVSGASKRGWTTWTTAAVDQRVVAIIPMVIDILNVQVSMLHHYDAYGFWAPAIQDYVNSGIPDWFGTPQMAALMDIEDPYQYRRRLTMPKFIINDTGDQFFLPDSSQFYFHDLLGVKYLRYIPNTDHSLRGSDFFDTLEACYQAVLAQAPLPQFSWTLQSSNSIHVVAEGSPTAVKLWQATNSIARDFRLQTIGTNWLSSPLTNQGDGVYVGTVPVLAQGWTGFFVELTYPGSGVPPYKFTTQVYVVPDVLPFHFTEFGPLAASASATPTNGAAPLTVQFIGQASGGRTTVTPIDTTEDHTGTVTAAGENNGINGFWEVATNAFDDTTGTKWLDFATNYPSTRQSWIQYQYTNGQSYIVSQYTITSANDAATHPERNPADWRLLGSNNGGASWVALDIRTNQVFTTNYQKLTYSCANAIAYNLYRFQIDRVANPTQAVAMQLDELEFILVPSPYSYSWSFGDGTTSTNQNPQHTYSANGNYTATLVVSDSLTMVTNTVIIYAAPSALTISQPGAALPKVR